MRHRGNALLGDAVVGKVELLHVTAVADAVEEKGEPLISNVVIIERQLADAHLLQRSGGDLDLLLSNATPHSGRPALLGIVQNQRMEMTRLQDGHQIAQCGSRKIQSSTCQMEWTRKR